VPLFATFAVAILIVSATMWLAAVSYQTTANAKELESIKEDQKQYSTDMHLIETDIAVIKNILQKKDK
ncbi:MAG: hypothetical protein ACHQUC_01450, partial [Chlamydiales bacterium]